MSMSRRQFLGASAAATAGCCLPAAAKSGKRPNILFIMTDQQHAGLMSCAGDPWVKTPALDALAESGIRFERAYASNPVCMPSRLSLQTGRMPSGAGMGTNEEVPVPEAWRRDNLGALLRRAGYETVYGGKVHVPKELHEAMFSDGYRLLTSNRRQELADLCCEFLQGSHEKPFFLFVSLINPHDICYMPINDGFRAQGKAPVDNIDSNVCEGVLDQARSAPDLAAFIGANCPPLPANYAIPKDEPEAVTTKYVNGGDYGGLAFRRYCREQYTDDDWRLFRWCYRRLMEMVDAKIGQILAALHAAGLARETLVVYTSDHGDLDGAHRLEHKSLPYEESARVPFIMSWEGVIAPGQVDEEHFVNNGLDLLPTLCDYAGAGAPAGLPGRSVRPVAEGGAPADWPDHVVVESQYGRMVRTDRYKYTVFDSGKNREMLVDLKNDPGELVNLARRDALQPVLDRHRRLLADWVARTGDPIAPAYLVSLPEHERT